MAVQRRHNPFNLKRRETDASEHRAESILCAKPASFVGIRCNRRIVVDRLLYDCLCQKLTLRLAIESKGETEGLGKVVQYDLERLRIFQFSFNTGAFPTSGLSRRSKVYRFGTLKS